MLILAQSLFLWVAGQNNTFLPFVFVGFALPEHE
jgi:hypothetical protein